MALEARPKTMIILPVKWVASSEGYKLNTDGCSLENPGLSGEGGVVLDSQGDCFSGFHVFLASLRASMQS